MIFYKKIHDKFLTYFVWIIIYKSTITNMAEVLKLEVISDEFKMMMMMMMMMMTTTTTTA